MVFTELFFAFYNGYSGQIYFAEWLPLLFNAFWTSWPCMMNYALDQDVNNEFSLLNPMLYNAGPSGKFFNFKQFWFWMLSSFWHGVVCFWFIVFVKFYSYALEIRFFSHFILALTKTGIMEDIGGIQP